MSNFYARHSELRAPQKISGPVPKVPLDPLLNGPGEASVLSLREPVKRDDVHSRKAQHMRDLVRSPSHYSLAFASECNDCFSAVKLSDGSIPSRAFNLLLQ